MSWFPLPFNLDLLPSSVTYYGWVILLFPLSAKTSPRGSELSVFNELTPKQSAARNIAGLEEGSSVREWVGSREKPSLWIHNDSLVSDYYIDILYYDYYIFLQTCQHCDHLKQVHNMAENWKQNVEITTKKQQQKQNSQRTVEQVKVKFRCNTN